MVGARRRTRSKEPLLGSHQKCWLWGRHVVLETLRAGRWRPHEVWLADSAGTELSAEIGKLAAAHEIPVMVKTADELSRRCGQRDHQGVLAKMPPFPYELLSELFERSTAERPLYLLLDDLQDPHNVGAIIRSAAALGVAGVVLVGKNACEVTSHVARSSAGAVNAIPIVRESSWEAMLQACRRHGVTVVAASEKAQRSVWEFDFRRSCAIVMGNEGRGVDDALAGECAEMIRIPQCGTIASLNVAAAAAIVVAEARRQTQVS